MNTKQMLRNIQQLKLYSYSFKSDAFTDINTETFLDEERKEIGLIAQEVEKILPDAVQKSVRFFLLSNNIFLQPKSLNNKENVLLLNKVRTKCYKILLPKARIVYSWNPLELSRN